MKNTLPIQLLFAAFLLLNLNSCNTNASSVDEGLIRQTLNELKSSDNPDNEEIYSYIEEMYSRAGHQLIWTEEVKAEALEILGNAEIHGLNSDDYRYEELLNAGEDASNSLSDLETDITFTYGMLQFGRHLLEGKTSPEQFFDNWEYKRRQFSSATAGLLQESIEENNLDKYVSSLMPEAGYYEGLMLWMQKYYEGDYDHISKINFDNLPIKKGESHPAIPEVKYRLSQFASYSGSNPSEIFDDELEAALEDFQTKMGLPTDGIIDQNTLDALNMSPEEKKDMLRINMERARWLLHNLPEKFLIVNIAAYELYIYDNHEKVYKTPVIVGKVHHETPVFHDTMEYIEFNCTWTVPRSITGEILSSVQNNPDYLESRHFEVLSGEEVIDASTIDWESFTAEDFPYVFRQKPGDFNSLGTMKFIFPNEYAVYLHDTPAKSLFEKEGTRAFSHGCVRVKDPKALAAFILADQGVKESEIDSILATQETTRVILENPLPVFLTYWTVFPEFPFNDPNTMHFVHDVYGRDEAILDALDNR